MKNKKIIALILSVLMIFQLISPYAALAFEMPDWEFIEGNSSLVINSDDAMDFTDQYGMPWYSIKNSIKQVIINDGVSKIAPFSFFLCKNLEDVVIPDSVTYIDEYAFSDCYKLSEIYIPESVSFIGTTAFYGCPITNIVLPPNISSIENNLFNNCRNLTSINIPVGVTIIDFAAFLNCESLTEITIPNSVCEIGKNAFLDCDSLTDVYFTGSQSEWEMIAFAQGNDALLNANIHFGQASVSDFYFSKYPDKMEYNIGDTFDPTGAELTIEYNDGTCQIISSEEIWFDNISSDFIFEEEGLFSVFTTCEGLMASFDVTVYSSRPWRFDEATGTLTISENIDDYSEAYYTPWFEYSEFVTSIVIDEGVTYIGSNAFGYFVNLTEVNLASTVESIGDHAFFNATSLQTVHLPKNLSFLHDTAFEFASSLNCFTVDKENEYFSAENGVLFNKDQTMLITYPVAKEDDTYLMPNSVTTIRQYSFKNNNYLKTIILSESLENLENYSFYDCVNLKKVSINSNITQLSSSIFYGCYNLENISVGDVNERYTSDNGIVFNKNSNELIIYPAGKKDTSYTVPSYITYIEDNAFSENKNLIEINIPNEVTYIGWYAFNNCTNLKNITLPINLKDISGSMLRNCSSLETVTIPAVSSIGYAAFNGATSLETIYFIGTQEDWDNIDIGDANEPLYNAEIVFTPKTIESISIYQFPDQIEYTVGDYISLEGLKISVNYEDGMTKILDYSEVTTDAPEYADQDGAITVTVTYKDFTDSFDLVVIPSRYLNNIYVSTYPDKIYYYDTEINDISLEGMWITAEYSDSYREEIYYADGSVGYDIDLDPDSETFGLVTVYYEGFEAQIYLTIHKTPFENFEYVGGPLTVYENINGEISTDENGNEYFAYYYDDILSTVEKPFKVTYKNGDQVFVDAYESLGEFYITTYSNQYENHWTKDSENNIITVFLAGYEVQIPVTVLDKPTVTNVEIVNLPYNTTHYDTALEDRINYDGLELKVTLSDGNERYLSYYDYYEEFNINYTLNTDKESENYGTVTVTVNDQASASFSLNIIENPVSKIEYVGGSLELIEDMNCQTEIDYNDVPFTYYHSYDSVLHNQGDVFKFTYKDGRTEYYALHNYIGNGEYSMYTQCDQYANHWTKDSENYLTVIYAGLETTVPVRLIENPYANFEYIGDPIYAVENTLGYYETDYEGNKFFYYEYESYAFNESLGDDFKLTYKNGDTAYVDMWYNYNGISTSVVSNQYENHWTKDSDNNFISVTFAGFETKIPVIITENPYKELEYVGPPISVYENANGYFEFDEYGNEYFWYYYDDLLFGIESPFKVTLKDGSEKYIDAYNLDECYSNQNENYWTVGSDNNFITAVFAGLETKIPVTIKEKPTVTEIEIDTLPYRTNYYDGDLDYIEMHGLSVNILLSDGSTEHLNYYDYSDWLDMTYSVNSDKTSADYGVVTVDVNGASTTFKLDVKENPVASLEYMGDGIEIIENSNCNFEQDENGNKFAYYLADNVLSSQGEVFKVTFKNGNVKYLSLYEYIDPYYYIDYTSDQYENHWTKDSENYCTVYFYDIEISIPVKIIESPFTDISIKAPKTVYKYGDMNYGYMNNGEYTISGINITDLEITATLKDGSTKTFYGKDFDAQWGTLGGYPLSYTSYIEEVEFGKYDVEINFAGLDASFQIEVCPNNLESVDILSLPYETVEYGSFVPDFIGAKFKINYTDGTSKTVTVTKDNIILSGRNIYVTENGYILLEIEYDNSVMSDYRYFVNCYESSFHMLDLLVTYDSASYTSIEVKNPNINFTNMELVATKEDGTVETYKLTNDVESDVGGFGGAGVIPKWFYTLTDKGILETIFVVYVDEVDRNKIIGYGADALGLSWYVDAKDRTEQSINVKTLPSKTEYVMGEDFDPEGLEVELVYSDGFTETLEEGYTISEFDSTLPGTKTITVTYKDFKTTFDVTVTEPEIEGTDWYYDSSTKTLTVYGNGAMPDYTSRGTPWFEYAKEIKNVVVKDGVTSVGNYAFAYLDVLFNVSLAESVTSIGNMAFYKDEMVLTINIPKNLKQLGTNAFYNCKNLRQIILPEGITSIPAYSFYNCELLENVKIPSTVTTIGKYAFYGCKTFTEVEIPSGVATIPTYAFWGCTKIQSLTIPNTVTSIEKYAFYFCNKLETVTFMGTRDEWLAITIDIYNTPVLDAEIRFPVSDNIFWSYNETDSTIHFSGEGEMPDFTQRSTPWYSLTATKVIVDEGITYLSNYALAYNTTITDVTLPQSLTKIGTFAAYKCTSLVNINIPDNVTSIGSNAFQNCTSLASIHIPAGITRIENYTFKECESLANVQLHNAITYIGKHAFYGCKTFTEVVITNAISEIDEYAFWGCTKLVTITLPGSIKNVKRYAFNFCNKLETVYFNGTVKDWEKVTFGIYNDPIKNAEIIYTGGLEISATSITLNDDISINFKANAEIFEREEFETLYLLIELNGKTHKIYDYTVKDGMYVFTYDNVGPDKMTDKMLATIYAKDAEKEYVSDTITYSMKDYLRSLLKTYSKNEKLRTLVVDLLNYGALAQQYTGHNVSDLANASLTETQKSWATQGDVSYTSSLDKAYETAQNAYVNWTGVGLNLNKTTSMKLKFRAESVEGLTVLATCGDQSWTLTKSDISKVGYDYIIYFSELDASQIRDNVYFTFYKDGEKVSDTLCYSVESYVAIMENNETLMPLLKSMLKYGDSAKAYIQ